MIAEPGPGGTLKDGAQVLGDLDMRFDMARNISPREHQRLDFGDSIVFTIKAVRSGRP